MQDNTNTERNTDMDPYSKHGSKPRFDIRRAESNAHLRVHGHCEREVVKINLNMV
jgi:hypothetical protein